MSPLLIHGIVELTRYAQVFGSLQTLTVASRMTWAFARGEYPSPRCFLYLLLTYNKMVDYPTPNSGPRSTQPYTCR
jgi:hypothetical protein